MINLLPPQGKKLLQREYSMRVCAVAGGVLAVSLFLSAVALVPSYVLFLEPETPALPGEKNASEEAQYTTLADTLKTSALFVAQLGKTVPTLAVSETVAHIESALSSDIALEGMLFSQEKNKTHIRARGTARTRESLRHFLDTLKQDTFFLDAQVPVSELAPDTNLLFTLTLVVRSK